MFRDYMKDEGKKTYIYIIAIAFCIIFSGNIYSSVKYHKYRGLCDKYREQLITAEEANRKLTDRFGRVTEITGRIKETANANIAVSRDIIETVEILRTQIQELENICYGSDSIDSYYNYYDSYYRDEGLMD